MNKKVFVILLVVVVVVGFVVGFATAKKGDAEDITTTTLPLVDVNDEPETEEFVEKDAESEIKTETTEETTEESQTEELRSEPIITDFFTLQMPAEWSGECDHKKSNPNSDGCILKFYHIDTQEIDSKAGELFTIEVYPKTSDDDFENPVVETELIKVIVRDGVEYNVVLTKPSYPDYTDDTKEEYLKFQNSAYELIATMQTVEGVEVVGNEGPKG